jgi:hypothetical protein
MMHSSSVLRTRAWAGVSFWKMEWVGVRGEDEWVGVEKQPSYGVSPVRWPVIVNEGVSNGVSGAIVSHAAVSRRSTGSRQARRTGEGRMTNDEWPGQTGGCDTAGGGARGRLT